MNMQILPALRKVFIVLFLAVVFAFYLWTASSSGNPFIFGKKLSDYYNLLSDAFLAGRLSLLVEPSKELLNLPDPYDPSLNAKFRLHDASLYKRKYYLYFGPVPALTFFIPFRFLFHGDMPENFATALFCFGGLIWSVLLLNLLTKAYVPNTSFWMCFVSVFCLSFCNVAPFILRRPAVYEAAIACGYFFLFGSLYWLVSGGFLAGEGKSRSWRLLLGSLFLGLAVGSRIYYIFASACLFFVWLKFFRERHSAHSGKMLKESLYLFVPFLICISLLGLYNYERFGSWTEFGIRYVLAGYYMPTYMDKFHDPSRILPGLYFYFLAPSRIDLEFPFFHLDPLYPWALPRGYYGPEPVAGVLTTIPFLNILLLYPLIFYKDLKESNLYLGLMLAFLILLALALSFFVVLAGVTMRYEVDFVSLWLLSAALLWFYLDTRLTERKARRFILRFASVTLIIYGCLFNVAISMTGYSDWLKIRNLDTYQRIEKFFVPLQRVAARYFARNSILSIENPNGVERSGGQSFWMGRGDTVIKVISNRSGVLMLGGHFSAGPSLPETPIRRLLVGTDSGYQKEEVFTGEGDGSIAVPVDVGLTRIVLRPLDTPTVTQLPNGDPRPLLLRISGLRIENLW